MAVQLYWFFSLCLNVTVINLMILGLLRLWKLRRSQKREPARSSELDAFPFVVVQLPVFNESDVLPRLLGAVTKLEYPRERLEIQILDDSTDDTTELARSLVERYRAEGHAVSLVTREGRQGYKAGALQNGLSLTAAELVAVFDADFLPQSDFLLRALPTLLEDSKLAFVQARWGHLNRDYSYLTRLQSLALDGHFLVDQSVRSWAQFPMNFNGTAGIWRRQAIESSGGWHGDTVCEDLDLSYRAISRGWKATYLEELVVPAEISPQLQAFKQQQFRWAKGSAQVFRKLMPLVLLGPLPWWKKVMGVLHLSGNICAPAMLGLVLVTPWVALTATPESLKGLWMFSIGQLAFLFFYLLVLRLGFPKAWTYRARVELPGLAVMGIAMSLNNTVAVLEGLFGMGGNRFERTPKFNVVDRRDRWSNSRYRLPIRPMVAGELGLSLYCLVSSWVVWNHGMKIFLPGMLVYGLAFGGFALLSLWQARRDLL